MNHFEIDKQKSITMTCDQRIYIYKWINRKIKKFYLIMGFNENTLFAKEINYDTFEIITKKGDWTL